MGKRVIRLTESDLRKVILNIISEQNSSIKTIAGSTSPEPIINAKVLTQYGLPANNTNFKGVWSLSGGWDKVIVPTFTKVKNLSMFTPMEGGDDSKDFIEFYVYPKINGRFDAEKRKVIRLEGSGSISADVFYKKDDVTWMLMSVKGSGNGLLALARAMKTDTTNKFPTEINIDLGSKTRKSSMSSWDSGKINSIQPFMNSMSGIVASSILNKLKVKTKDKLFVRLYGKTDDELIDEMEKWITGHDYKFAEKSYDTTKLTKIDLSDLVNVLNDLPKITYDDIRRPKNDRVYQSIYGNKVKVIESRIKEEMVKRIKSYVELEFPDRVDEIMSTIDLKGILRIGYSLENALKGVTYGTGGTSKGAEKSNTSGEYDLGG